MDGSMEHPSGQTRIFEYNFSKYFVSEIVSHGCDYYTMKVLHMTSFRMKIVIFLRVPIVFEILSNEKNVTLC